MVLTGKTQVEKADATLDIAKSEKPVKLIDKEFGLDIDGIIHNIIVGPNGYEYVFEVLEDHREDGFEKGQTIFFEFDGLDEVQLL